MLSNSIALIAVAVMLAVEAYKASDRVPRIVLAAIAVAFILSGVFLKPITMASPKI
ncbi:MAG: hypothetical protein V4472_04085 [Pseudomonadota bacterium]